MKIITLLLMFYCHKIEDFNLQSTLASFKSEKWWKENYPDEKCKNDWRISLFIHSLSWSIAIMIPVFLFGYINNIINTGFCLFCLVTVCINTVIHMVIDDLKANKNKINLICDQCIHFGQILISWFTLISIYSSFFPPK